MCTVNGEILIFRSESSSITHSWGKKMERKTTTKVYSVVSEDLQYNVSRCWQIFSDFTKYCAILYNIVKYCLILFNIMQVAIPDLSFLCCNNILREIYETS